MDKIQAIILAGGKGVRLAPLTDNCPKPLVAVGGVPMIQHVLRHLSRAGIRTVAIATAHLGQMIEESLGDGSHLGMQISYLREPEPMGTGGWTKLVDWEALDEHFLVLNADNLTWLDIGKFFDRHTSTNAIATIGGVEKPAAEVHNYELLLADDAGARLVSYLDRSCTSEHLAKRASAFVSSGWYIMSPAVRDFVPDVLPLSNETQFWPALARSGQTLGFYPVTEPWFDSGTIERLQRVEQFLNDHPEYGFDA